MLRILERVVLLMALNCWMVLIEWWMGSSGISTGTPSGSTGGNACDCAASGLGFGCVFCLFIDRAGFTARAKFLARQMECVKYGGRVVLRYTI